MRAGSSTSRSVEPSCPSCPPGLRLLFFRSDFGSGLASPSELGGFEEFHEFTPSRALNSAISARACASASSATASLTSAAVNAAACATTSAASSSYDGAR